MTSAYDCLFASNVQFVCFPLNGGNMSLQPHSGMELNGLNRTYSAGENDTNLVQSWPRCK